MDETNEFALSRSAFEESVDELDKSPPETNDVADLLDVAVSQRFIS